MWLAGAPEEPQGRAPSKEFLQGNQMTCNLSAVALAKMLDGLLDVFGRAIAA
jgi:hypothetical protein